MTDGTVSNQSCSQGQGMPRSLAPLNAEAGPLHVVTTASNPTTPGPSTPTTIRTLPFEKSSSVDGKGSCEIIPPTRPSSTPFPLQLPIRANRRLDGDFASIDTDPPQQTSRSSRLCDLPIEIHECILDHLSGQRRAASNQNSPYKLKAACSWATALRHARRREVSELALVSKKWRELIQDRLYRHLKIKGTRDSVNDATLWFFRHPHLCAYVRHVEVWFPVFHPRGPPPPRTQHSVTMRAEALALAEIGARLQDPSGSIRFQSPPNNCTLEEIFLFIQMTFSAICILTLEGGEKRKPPKVQHYLSGKASDQSLPRLPTVRTLVCKSQWNLIRSHEDFDNIARALPNLNEWHGSYARPKSKGYITMGTIFPGIPRHLTRLNICLEADYRWEAVSPPFARKINRSFHFCTQMARAIPTLENFGYTGRVCKAFFDAGSTRSDPRTSRLKSIDIVVKNICRPQVQWNDGSGTTDMGFILAFEALVIGGIRALERLTALTSLRIRFIDLDSQSPPPNPYFQLENDICTGLWSEPIVQDLAKSRPTASFVEQLACSNTEAGRPTKPTGRANIRPLLIKVSSYGTLTSGITIT